jgi:hypothetical protein
MMSEAAVKVAPNTTHHPLVKSRKTAHNQKAQKFHLQAAACT